MSTASAKPALKPAERLERSLKKFGIDDYQDGQDIKGLWLSVSDWERFISEVKVLESQPAAERTTLKEIQETIEARLSAMSMPKGSSTEDTLRWVLSLFDAQERAGAKA